MAAACNDSSSMALLPWISDPSAIYSPLNRSLTCSPGVGVDDMDQLLGSSSCTFDDNEADVMMDQIHNNIKLLSQDEVNCMSYFSPCDDSHGLISAADISGAGSLSSSPEIANPQALFDRDGPETPPNEVVQVGQVSSQGQGAVQALMSHSCRKARLRHNSMTPPQQTPTSSVDNTPQPSQSKRFKMTPRPSTSRHTHGPQPRILEMHAEHAHPSSPGHRRLSAQTYPTPPPPLLRVQQQEQQYERFLLQLQQRSDELRRREAAQQLRIQVESPHERPLPGPKLEPEQLPSMSLSEAAERLLAAQDQLSPSPAMRRRINATGSNLGNATPYSGSSRPGTPSPSLPGPASGSFSGPQMQLIAPELQHYNTDLEWQPQCLSSSQGRSSQLPRRFQAQEGPMGHVGRPADQGVGAAGPPSIANLKDPDSSQWFLPDTDLAGYATWAGLTLPPGLQPGTAPGQRVGTTSLDPVPGQFLPLAAQSQLLPASENDQPESKPQASHLPRAHTQIAGGRGPKVQQGNSTLQQGLVRLSATTEGLFPALALPPEGTPMHSPSASATPSPGSRHGNAHGQQAVSASAAAASALSSASALASALAAVSADLHNSGKAPEPSHSSTLRRKLALKGSRFGSFHQTDIPFEVLSRRAFPPEGSGEGGCSMLENIVKEHPLRESAEAGTQQATTPGQCSFPGGLLGNSPEMKGRFLRAAQKLLLEVCRCPTVVGHLKRAGQGRNLSNFQKRGGESWMRSHGSGGVQQYERSKGMCNQDLTRGGTREQAMRLRSLLQEVNKRYNSYKEKLHPLVLAFSAVAGHSEAATPYTAPSLLAISMAFRRIGDTINAHLRHMQAL